MRTYHLECRTCGLSREYPTQAEALTAASIHVAYYIDHTAWAVTLERGFVVASSTYTGWRALEVEARERFRQRGEEVL